MDVLRTSHQSSALTTEITFRLHSLLLKSISYILSFQ